MRGRIAIPVALLGIMVTWLVGDLAAQDGRFEWDGELRPGQVLEVQGIVGDITAEYTTSSTAEVVAVKEGRASDFDEVEIRVVAEREGYTICAVYHAHAARGDGCDNNHDGDDREDRRHSIDVEVNYVVRVPAGVDFHGEMVSGDVSADGLRSDVHANTINGDIYTDWGALEFHTVSGDITLWLPAGIDTDVDFGSLSGDLDSDFDITMTGRQSRRWVGSEVEGHIGSRGARSLSLNTVSGDVRLRRAR